MTEFSTLMQQHWNPFVIKRFKLRIGINVKNINADAEFGYQRKQRQLHVVAQVAVRTRD